MVSKTDLKKRIFISAAVLLPVCLLIFFLNIPAYHEIPVTGEIYCFDTLCSISIYNMKSMTKMNAQRAVNDALAECTRYENMLSTTKEGSDIYRLNHAKGEPVECSVDTIKLLEMGKEAGLISDGRFDITIGRVTSLWDFHSSSPDIPDKEEIEKALETVNYDWIGTSGNKAVLLNEEAAVDLGGIAKGYVGDRLCEFLRKRSVTSAVINLGGNVCVIGGKTTPASVGSKSESFKVGIEAPFSNRRELLQTVEVNDSTLVTSGVYERYFEKDGVRYHHVIDSKTGYPADTDLLSVTVLGPSGSSADCDAYSTVCLILGEKEGMKLIESKDGFEALFARDDGSVVTTKGWP